MQSLEAYKNQFNKIQLLNHMANQIGAFGEQSGLLQFMEAMDMNCGAVPDGEFEQVIDLDGAEQFLSMYTQTAHLRFAFAVINVFKIHPDCRRIVSDFCTQIGRDLELEPPSSAREAFDAVRYFVLDGMPEESLVTISSQDSGSICWKAEQDNVSKFWTRFKGDPADYAFLLTSFVNGMLESSAFRFTALPSLSYSITHI